MSNNTSKLLNKSKKHLEIEYFRIIEDTNLKNKNVHGLDKARREIGIIPIYQGFLRRDVPWKKNSISLDTTIPQKKDIQIPNLNFGDYMSPSFNLRTFLLEFRTDFFKNKKILDNDTLSSMERRHNRIIRLNTDGFSNIEPVNDTDYEYFNDLFDKLDDFVNDYQAYLDNWVRTSLHRNMMPVLIKYNNKYFLTFTFKLFISNRNYSNHMLVNRDISNCFESFFTYNKMNEYSIATVFKPSTGTGALQKNNPFILDECMIYDNLEINDKNNFFRLKTNKDRCHFFQKILLTEAQLFGHLSSFSRTDLIGQGSSFTEWTKCQHFSISFELKGITNEPNFKKTLESLSFYLSLLENVKE